MDAGPVPLPELGGLPRPHTLRIFRAHRASGLGRPHAPGGVPGLTVLDRHRGSQQKRRSKKGKAVLPPTI